MDVALRQNPRAFRRNSSQVRHAILVDAQKRVKNGRNQDRSLANAVAQGLWAQEPQLCLISLCAGLDNLDEIVRIVQQSGGLEYTMERARKAIRDMLSVGEEQVWRLTDSGEEERDAPSRTAIYRTIDHTYEAEIIRQLGRFFTKGAIYHGEKPVHWCYSCKTALAEAEVEYDENHVSPSIDVRFPLAEADRDKRIKVAEAGATAVEGENESKIKVANSNALRRQAEAEAER